MVQGDIASLILEKLQEDWSIDDPSLEEIAFRLDEFDPKEPKFQIVIENFPKRSTWVVDGIYRVEHRCKISIYCKLIKYDLDTVAMYREKWYNMKSEIDRILIANKFSITGINNLELPGGWDDKDTIAVGRGVKEGRFGGEYIYWYSEQIVTGVYYEKEELEGESYE